MLRVRPYPAGRRGWQDLACGLGTRGTGGSDEAPPRPSDAAIVFATAAALVASALKAVRRVGRMVRPGIHMSDIPASPHAPLREVRQLVPADLRRRDGIDVLTRVPKTGITMRTTRHPLQDTNQALADLRAGRFKGAAVLVPSRPGHDPTPKAYG